jgi:hypothetical protein
LSIADGLSLSLDMVRVFIGYVATVQGADISESLIRIVYSSIACSHHHTSFRVNLKCSEITIHDYNFRFGANYLNDNLMLYWRYLQSVHHDGVPVAVSVNEQAASSVVLITHLVVKAQEMGVAEKVKDRER